MNRSHFITTSTPDKQWVFKDERTMVKIMPHYSLTVIEWHKNEEGTKIFYTSDVRNTDTRKIVKPSQFRDSWEEARATCQEIYENAIE